MGILAKLRAVFKPCKVMFRSKNFYAIAAMALFFVILGYREKDSVSQGSLSKARAEKVQRKMLDAHRKQILDTYGAQWDSRALTYNDGSADYAMPFYYNKFDPRPADGYALIISMHGGGGAPKALNDSQYGNQKHLYDREFAKLGLNGFIYLAPRAPTNDWDLWHKSHIDHFFNLLIQLAVAKEGVNPNKVYIIGYSAGGDGVYQLAPRMAYRFAAASMMAGHPNEASPLGLRNLPFAIHVGALDDAFDRNKKAAEWKASLEALHAKDPDGYIHQVVLHEGKGHWMGFQEAKEAFPFMFKYTRRAIPERVVWVQDDVHHERFYWLGVPKALIQTGGEVIATYERAANTVHIEKSYAAKVRLYLNDAMLNLDNPVIVMYNGKEIYRGIAPRTKENIKATVEDFGDPDLVFPAVLELSLP